jgi:hypothetical protein
MKIVQNIILLFIIYFLNCPVVFSQNNYSNSYQSRSFNKQNYGEQGSRYEESNGNMRGGKDQQNNDQMNRHRTAGREYMMNLRQNEPDEFQRLMKLRQSNPNVFQNEMRSRIFKQFSKQEHSKGNNTSYCDLARKYKNSNSAKERIQLKHELKNVLEKDFDRKQQGRKDNIKKMTETLDKLKKQINEQDANKNNYLNQQLNDILK